MNKEKTIKLQVGLQEDRIAIINALANSGYYVRITEERKRWDTLFYIEIIL